MNTLQYFCSKLWICFCLSLLIVGCADSKDTAPASESKASPVELKTTSDLSEIFSQPVDALGPVAAEEMLWTKLMNADEETYVVLLRHAIAPGTGDPEKFQLDDCSTQRNLSEAGRQQARKIGEAFRDRNVPVTQVLSSQWCRCLETAKLMEIATVEPFPPLNSFFRDRNTAETQTTQIKDYIATNKDPGVIVMVTHQVNITALSDIFPQSGSAVVIQLQDGYLNVLGQLLSDNS